MSRSNGDVSTAPGHAVDLDALPDDVLHAVAMRLGPRNGLGSLRQTSKRIKSRLDACLTELRVRPGPALEALTLTRWAAVGACDAAGEAPFAPAGRQPGDCPVLEAFEHWPCLQAIRVAVEEAHMCPTLVQQLIEEGLRTRRLAGAHKVVSMIIDNNGGAGVPAGDDGASKALALVTTLHLLVAGPMTPEECYQQLEGSTACFKAEAAFAAVWLAIRGEQPPPIQALLPANHRHRHLSLALAALAAAGQGRLQQAAEYGAGLAITSASSSSKWRSHLKAIAAALHPQPGGGARAAPAGAAASAEHLQTIERALAAGEAPVANGGPEVDAAEDFTALARVLPGLAAGDTRAAEALAESRELVTREAKTLLWTCIVVAHSIRPYSLVTRQRLDSLLSCSQNLAAGDGACFKRPRLCAFLLLARGEAGSPQLAAAHDESCNRLPNPGYRLTAAASGVDLVAGLLCLLGLRLLCADDTQLLLLLHPGLERGGIRLLHEPSVEAVGAMAALAELLGGAERVVPHGWAALAAMQAMRGDALGACSSLRRLAAAAYEAQRAAGGPPAVGAAPGDVHVFKPAVLATNLAKDAVAACCLVGNEALLLGVLAEVDRAQAEPAAQEAAQAAAPPAGEREEGAASHAAANPSAAAAAAGAAPKADGELWQAAQQQQQEQQQQDVAAAPRGGANPLLPLRLRRLPEFALDCVLMAARASRGDWARRLCREALAGQMEHPEGPSPQLGVVLHVASWQLLLQVSRSAAQPADAQLLSIVAAMLAVTQTLRHPRPQDTGGPRLAVGDVATGLHWASLLHKRERGGGRPGLDGPQLPLPRVTGALLIALRLLYDPLFYALADEAVGRLRFGLAVLRQTCHVAAAALAPAADAGGEAAAAGGGTRQLPAFHLAACVHLIRYGIKCMARPSASNGAGAGNARQAMQAAVHEAVVFGGPCWHKEPDTVSRMDAELVRSGMAVTAAELRALAGLQQQQE